MARLGKDMEGDWRLGQEERPMAWVRRTERMMDDLVARSDALKEGEIVGAVLAWPVADGRAYYVVTKESPLTLSHVPYLDNYAVDPVFIRGLRRSDVEDELRA